MPKRQQPSSSAGTGKEDIRNRAEKQKADREKKKADRAKKVAEAWKSIDLKKEGLLLPSEPSLQKHPVFNWRKKSLLDIFLCFVPRGVLHDIARDLDPDCVRYPDNTVPHISISRAYKCLAIWIKVYGEQNPPSGVRKNTRPLASQLKRIRLEFKNEFPRLHWLDLCLISTVAKVD
mmetsp:Transcript_9572/g.15910  ORF Transcript_9572/g.15910 Transcript_9572/m.15910 type:complete len:176 (+) Transcript_9572:61-588(+)